MFPNPLLTGVDPLGALHRPPPSISGSGVAVTTTTTGEEGTGGIASSGTGVTVDATGVNVAVGVGYPINTNDTTLNSPGSKTSDIGVDGYPSKKNLTGIPTKFSSLGATTKLPNIPFVINARDDS